MMRDLRRFRFLGTNRAHSMIWAITGDPSVAADWPGIRAYQRAPGITEYELMMGEKNPLFDEALGVMRERGQIK